MRIRNSIRFKTLVGLLRNMGLPYVAYRLWHALQIRSGWLKIRFPNHSGQQQHIPLDVWKKQQMRFFLPETCSDRPALATNNENSTSLKARVAGIHQDTFLFFSHTFFRVTDWHTNPENGFKYEAEKHWSEIRDFSSEAGDIKYVWEKSRFTFLYDLIRYEDHFSHDQSSFVFSRIEGWIEANPVNCGPNWKCSQEITLRVLNWTFALHYYKNSPNLSEAIFQNILHSIYRQMQHVEENIRFSRIVVRNNHALTEALGLYTVGLLYPFFPESSRWKEKGRKYFEQEIAYQIYEDGTFLQFSMNYHRVAIQLLTWAIRLAEVNGEKWSTTVYNRAKKSFQFLRACQDNKSGWLPDYGHNDGALFFPLTDCHFRDFRPQLGTLAHILKIDPCYKDGIWQEDAFWFGIKNPQNAASLKNALTSDRLPVTHTFSKSGYYLLHDQETITFVRCGSYKDRPGQADNLHLDIWADGENILFDAGSYKYNADDDAIRYFMGTASHNTVMIGDYDQMLKGPGFIWHNWIKQASGAWKQLQHNSIFEGFFDGFSQTGRIIRHRRKVMKISGKRFWEIEDWIENKPPSMSVHQLWHPSQYFLKHFNICAFDQTGNAIERKIATGWHSEYYGEKKETQVITFTSGQSYIRTIIEEKAVKASTPDLFLQTPHPHCPIK
jgi:hypothetical protein